MINLKEKLLSLDCFEENDYLDFYCNLIKANLDTKKIKYKTQAHHSIPCLFYSNRKQATLDENNILVNLKYSDHVKAHYYLCLACKKSSQNYFKLLSAFIYMSNNKQACNKNQYSTFILNYNLDNCELQQNLYEDYIKLLAKHNSELNTGKVLSDEHKAKISSANKGKLLSKERKQHLAEINLGKHHSKETKLKLSKSHLGQGAGNRWMKKGVITKSVAAEEFDKYLNNGWTFGRATADSRRIKIRCCETGEVFESCQAADKYYHCCTRRAINNGTLAAGLHWEKF